MPVTQSVIPTALDPSQVLELRQYTLHPGKRDTLIELFDRAFVESQESLGMRVLGQFRDLDAPDRFVWLRGFPDLASRAAPLEAFYGGPVWQANRGAANATMIDSDNVLLLRPVGSGSGFVLPEARAAAGAAAESTGAAAARTAAAAGSAGAAAVAAADPPAGGLVVATIYLLREPADDGFVQWFDTRVASVMAATGAPPIARFRTEYGKNDFPQLPVRDGEHAFVWFTSFATVEAHAQHRAALARVAAEDAALVELARRCASPAQVLRLTPTARSLVRHADPVGYTLAREGGAHDFDFIAGEWTILHRRLVARGAGSSAWDEFPSTHRAALHLGGIANVEEISCPARGWSGMAVRAYRAATRQWSIYWISSSTGAVEPPMVGGFTGDRGEFYGEDHHDGRPIQVRFFWTRLGPDAARWEQAFCHDGQTWETNWIMEFTRVAR